MPFYLVEQKGVPGARLVEADKPAGALNHVIEDTFDVKRVDGRELLEAAKQYEAEVAGVKPKEPDDSEDEGSEGEEPRIVQSDEGTLAE